MPVPGLQSQEIARRRGTVTLDPLLRREGTSRNGWQPTADALLTIQARLQLVATGGNGFGLFEPFLGPSHLPWVATGCDR